MAIFGQGPSKKDLQQKIVTLENEVTRLRNLLAETVLTQEQVKYLDLNKEIEKLNSCKEDLNSQNKELQSKIVDLRKTLIGLKEIEELQSFGFYKTKYGLESSELYNQKLQEIRKKQKDMIKTKTATIHNTDYLVGGDKKKGKEFILDTVKLSLRAFNNECDNIISKVKFNNVEKSSERIKKIFKEINSLTDMQRVSIKQAYLRAKIEELYLKYEYECKKQEEKEEQQAIKERMREEAKVLKELEAARKKIEKEETHFSNAIKDLNEKLEKANDKEKLTLLEKIKELENKLKEVENAKQDLSNREQNTRAGYVYVISNIGSFGENVYKIGMTRRLDPMDRVKELGSASVPFKFDVHAMIFSEDAPSLENILHKKFEKNSVNKVNLRKEFFNVSLENIRKEVLKNHNATIEFTMLAEAQEYRESLAMSDNPVKNIISETIQPSVNNDDSIVKPITKQENKVSLNFEEMNYLSLIKRLVSDVIDTSQISYLKNNEYLEINLKNNPNKWICRLFLNKTKRNNIHLFDKENDVIMFDFDEMDDLKEIKDFFIKVVNEYI